MNSELIKKHTGIAFIFLGYVNNVVSDTEFVLLYDAYQSKKPDFNHQQYDPLISMTSIQPNVNCDATSCLLLSILGLEFSSKQFLTFCNSSLIFDSKLWRISHLTFQLSNPTHSPADASFLEGKYIADNHFSEHQHVVLVGPLHRRST